MADGQSLTGLLYRGAALDPLATAVVDGDVAVSYEDLLQRVESAGAALQGLLPDGSRVALCAANHIDHLVAYLAILMAGLVWVPLNPANGRELNSTIVQKAKPDLLLVGRESLQQAPETKHLCVLDELPPAGTMFKAKHSSIEEVAAIKFTGGTSGEPKGVVQTHGNMLAVIENMQVFYDFGSNDCNLAVAPLTHGSSHYLFPVLAVGGRHRFLHDSSPESILAALRGDTTVTFMPPTLIYKLMQTGRLSAAQFPTLRHLTYSAAPMPPDRIAEAQRAFGPCISSLYGQTEAPLTICALDTTDMQDPNLRGRAGKACANSRVRVVDERGIELATGEVGHIETKGPIVMQGYLDEPELTAATIRDGWLGTGDLGALDAEGYLTLSGRSSEVIITGGFNVYPAEIENVLATVPGVRECCVFGVPDEYWGERIEAVLVAGETLDESQLIAVVKRELGSVRTPKALHVVDALPRNAVGKVVRRDMIELLAHKREEHKEQETE